MTSTTLAFLIFISCSFPLHAKPRLPLPRDAFDGGVISAEALGRGGTIASNRGTPASGSENPAALASGFTDSLYTTISFHPSSSLPDPVVEASDPLSGKDLQYLSVGATKGVLFYEPIGRRRERQIIDPASPTTDFRDIEFSANAIGFAGVDQFSKEGSFGLSVAYLWSNITSDEHITGQNSQVVSDTADGVRMNLGVRYPTGAAMWGLVVQNAPGFLWGKDYRSEMLPVKVRLGNSWRVREGVLLSIEGERRFYRQGGDPEDFMYVGNESFISKNFVARLGAYGQNIGESEHRHWTVGFTFVSGTNARFSYALDSFKLLEEKVKQSVLSVQIPFNSEERE